MRDRLRLALIFGGRSVEHEVSVVSAQHFIDAADPERFDVIPIGVTRTGVWLTPAETRTQLDRPDPRFQKTLVAPGSDTDAASPIGGSAPSSPLSPSTERRPGGEVSRAVTTLETVDAVFPLVHGTHGEDGTLQGLLELLDLPYVGCGVAASGIGMDKALMKTAFAGAGLPVVDHMVVYTGELEEPLALARKVEARLGFPAFVKPANGGSSVGVGKARTREDFVAAFTEAARYDTKIVIEQGIEGIEVECGLLGNRNAMTSPVGTIRHKRDFYDYEAKYLDPETEIVAPLDLPAETIARIQNMSLRAFNAIEGAGLSRMDFFLLSDGSLIIDEINTLPGFTPASMYPRLWQAAGVSYSELITRLVDLGLARHREKRIA